MYLDKSEKVLNDVLLKNTTFYVTIRYTVLSTSLITSSCIGSVESKAVPLQAGTGPEGSRRLRLPDLKTIGT